jgi:hypothetical protein
MFRRYSDFLLRRIQIDPGYELLWTSYFQCNLSASKTINDLFNNVEGIQYKQGGHDCSKRK